MLQVPPRSLLNYRIPALAGGTLHFRASATPSIGNRGAVQISIAGNQPLLDEVLPPGREPLAVNTPLQARAMLQLKVDFSGQLAFPCSVDWRDAHIVALPEAAPKLPPEPELEPENAG